MQRRTLLKTSLGTALAIILGTHAGAQTMDKTTLVLPHFSGGGPAPMMENERLTECSNVMAWIERNVSRSATARAIALSPG